MIEAKRVNMTIEYPDGEKQPFTGSVLPVAFNKASQAALDLINAFDSLSTAMSALSDEFKLNPLEAKRFRGYVRYRRRYLREAMRRSAERMASENAKLQHEAEMRSL